MEKIVKSGLRDCTVNLDGSECAVKFDSCFRAFSVRNDSAADVFISKASGIIPDGDGVMCVKSGSSAVFAHMDIYANTVYLLGNGRVQVHAQNDSANPFNFAPTIDGGVQASGNPVIMDGLQGGVPFSELVVSGKNLFDYRMTAIPTGIAVTTMNDGSINVSGKMERDAAWGINFIIKNPLPKGKTYTLSINPDVIGVLPIGIYYIGAAKENQTFIWNRDEYFTVYLTIQPNVDYDFVFRPQLELGETATEYEPPITGRELTVGVSGKNLISGNIIKKTGTVTDNSDSWIIAWTAAMYVRFDKIFLKPNTDYTISWWQKSDNGTDCVRIGVINGDNESSIIEQSSAEIKTGTEYKLCSFTFNSGNNRNIYVQFLRASTTGTVYVKKSIQLELGSTATPYEPYHGAEYTITPDANPYTIPDDIRQQDGLNVISASEGELSVVGVRKNAAFKRIWDEIDEIKTAIIVSNGESE